MVIERSQKRVIAQRIESEPWQFIQVLYGPRQVGKTTLILHSLKDILMLTRVDKPVLMKRLFELGCGYSCQILSYTKILGYSAAGVPRA